MKWYLYKIILFSGLFVLKLQLLFGQSVHYRHYSVDDGLASSTVYNAWQDSKGYIWFGTESGLSRFDGTAFKTFTTADGLPSNTVLKVVEDAVGRLWLSCYNAKPAYYYQGKFYGEYEDPGLAQTNFTMDGFGTCYRHADEVYFYSSDAVYKLSDGSQVGFEKISKADLSPWMRVLTVHDSTVLCFGGQGIFELTPDGGLQPLLRFRKTLLGTMSAFAGTGNHFFYRSGRTLQMYQVGGDTAVLASELTFRHPLENLQCSEPGTIWVEVQQDGLYRVLFDSAGFGEVRHFPGIFNTNHILKDKEGVVWITTFDNGIYAIFSEDNYIVTEAHGLSSNKIYSLQGESSDRVLVGGVKSSIHVLEKGRPNRTISVKSSRLNSRVLSIQKHQPTGDVWAVTDEGLFRIGQRGGVEALKIASAKSLFVGENKVLAGFAMNFAVAVYPHLGLTWSDNPIKTMAITEGADKNIWVGKLDGPVVYHPSGKTLDLGKMYPGLLDTRITGFAAAANGGMWIATHQHGVVLLSKNMLLKAHLTTSNGLMSNVCQNIKLDHRGDVWVCTNEGLCKINPLDYQVTKYATANVLPDDDVNDVLVFGDTVWAATSKGVAIFRDNLPRTDPSFQTLASSLKINGAEYLPSPGNILVLPTDSNDVEVGFAALSTRSAGRFLYQVAIRRHGPPWWLMTWADLGAKLGTRGKLGKLVSSDTLLDNAIRLSNMNPGLYEFEVTAISYDGVRSQRPDRQSILIKPRFYSCLWWQALVVGLLAWLGWRFVKWQVVLARQQLVLKEEATTLKLEAFKAQINPHFIFNTINGIQRFFFPPDPARANEYIALFSGLLRKTLEFSEKTTVPFAQELAYLKEYLDLTVLRVGEKFQYRIEGADALPPGLEMPTMLLQPLVENAIVHGFPPEGTALLVLKFTLENGRATCQVDDNGTGINASLARRKANGDTRTPKGTLLVRHRVDVLNHLTKREIKLNVTDKADAGLGRGTLAVVSFKL